MRRSLVTYSTPIGKHAAVLSAPFSSAAGRGRGRGRGAAFDPPHSSAPSVPGQPNNVFAPGRGRGADEIRVPAARVNSGHNASDPTRPGPREFAKVPGDNVADPTRFGPREFARVPGDNAADPTRFGPREFTGVSGEYASKQTRPDPREFARVPVDDAAGSTPFGRKEFAGVPVDNAADPTRFDPREFAGVPGDDVAGPNRPAPGEFGRKMPDFIEKMRMEEQARLALRGGEFVGNKNDAGLGFGDFNASGAGRGSIDGGGIGPGIGVRQQQQNRFIRARLENVASGENANVPVRTPSKKFSTPEEARMNAMEILGRGDGSAVGGERLMGSGVGGERLMESGGRGFRGRGGRGLRGRGGRGGRFGGRGREEEEDDDDSDVDDAAFIGNDADGEKLAKKLGPEIMSKLVEGFEEMSESVLPSPQQDAYIDAMDTNYAIECEPEYLFGDFERNPDIDETPPMPIRECFEKAKPFLMAYENIQSHEEWEEAVEEAMENVPLMKQIVDHYSGPDRVTAKQQMGELDRVAKTLPQSAPDSVKRFTNRAVLSLQSNPGWGFDKKCMFMDKLVREVSQQHK